MKRRMGYGGEVKVLGLPRFDTWRRARHADSGAVHAHVARVPCQSLLPSAPNPSKQVPLMGSTYQLFVTDLLNSPRLRDALVTHDALPEFLPHYEMARWPRCSSRTP